MKKHIVVIMTIIMLLSTYMGAGVSAVTLDDWLSINTDYTKDVIVNFEILPFGALPCNLEDNSTYQNVFINSREKIDDLKLYTVAYFGGKTVYTKINDVDIIKGENNIYTKADLTGISYDNIKLFLFGSNMHPYMKSTSVSDTVVYKVTYENGFVYTDAFGDFSLPVAEKELYNFLGYYDNNNVRVTDENGKKLSTYNVTGNITLTAKFESAITITYGENKTVKLENDGSFNLPVPEKSGYKFIGYYDENNTKVTGDDGKKLSSYTITKSITVTAKFERVYSEADTETGELLGNPGARFYITNSSFASTNYGRMLARNPWDVALWNNKLYVGLGNFDNNTDAPPLYYYDLNEEEWDSVDFKTVKADATTYKWVETETATSTDINGTVTTTLDHEVSRFRVINDQLYLLGADITVTSLYGNFYTLETDVQNNEQWVTYRESTVYSTHLFDMMGIDNGGEKKDILFGNGTDNMEKGGAYVYKIGPTRNYTKVEFYDKNGNELFVKGSKYQFARVYDFFETSRGLYARLTLNNESNTNEAYIYKYSSSTDSNGKITHRFDYYCNYPSTITAYTHKDTGLNKSKRLNHHMTMADVTFNGYAYITNGYLYKTKDFNTVTKISAPNGAIISDLLMKNGKLYALGFVKQGTTTNYKNYVWTIDSADKFTQIREFTSENSYALSFDMDDEFFYVGMGGLSTYSNVGNVLRLAINPVNN